MFVSERKTIVIEGPGHPIFDPLDWWMEPAQRARYPRLSIMAMDLFTAPPQSSDNERLFSMGKFTITDLRTRLSLASVEASLCLKSWAQFR
jgi:hAT family C-terminal dimerisation region